jgi:hypothetical protein
MNYRLIPKTIVQTKVVKMLVDINLHRSRFTSNQILLDFLKRLILENEVGKAVAVSTEALAGLFELFADRVECVVLNACYSEVQAEAIAQHIPYVIGMNKAIGDRAAIEFAISFYDALGAGESIEFAYKLGCNAIRMAGIEEYLTPVLKKKPA